MRKLLIGIAAALLALNAISQEKPAAAPAAPDDQVLKDAQKQEQEEARRAAAAAKADEVRQRREELFKHCVIKPVMTDDEIEACKRAYRA